ncbi:MAG: hypothetical protein J6C82_04080 [Clostridia bacterium]|nr:hypothetical protein [Clostridia bacterium]
MKKKTKSILIRVIVSVVAVIVALAVAAVLFLNFYVIPKYNSTVSQNGGEEERLTGKDMLAFAKYLTDGQLLENIKNFNKSDAKDLLHTMMEIADETPDEEGTEAESVQEQAENSGTNAKNKPQITAEEIPQVIEESGIAISEEDKGAYNRIMSTAKKSEIAEGMAIVSKLDLAKVNELNRAGKKAELKSYIKSVLTSYEIKRALSFYSKYKHLL